ncbi:MAG: DUF6010 family protein [Bacteroidota bacterium]
MIPLIIGISSGILLVAVLVMLKQFDKQLIYGLILAGIGFLYIGFTWSDLPSLIINASQALVFLLFAYYGIKKSVYILSLGYFVHGSWDIAYSLFDKARLIPPHYDVFCLSFDFIIGMYLLIFERKARSTIKISKM